jgi:23S rRNA (uracil1939-C5)-methyltransferase
MTCRHFGVCGGCTRPGVPYGDQLVEKRARLMAWFPGVDVSPVTPSPRDARFRHKVAFVFGPGGARGRELLMGHYAQASRRIVPVQECPVHSDQGNTLAFALGDELSRARVPPALLRHVLIRTTEHGREAAVMLVVWRNDKTLRRPIRAFLESPARPTGFFLNVNDRPGPYLVGRHTIHLDGRSHVRETVGDAAFLVSPTAFFQTNVGAAGELLRVVLERVGTARRVLDLYSGSGLLAIPLAYGGATVVAVEENRVAVGDAEANRRLNRLPAGLLTLVRDRVEDALGRLGRAFDAVVLDPPRQGCPDAVLDRVFGHLSPSRAVYVSCNPERLSTERALIERHGYRLTALEGIDMFPHTEHIEAVATFDR